MPFISKSGEVGSIFIIMETLLSIVTSKQKEINENYTNNIALFINDYLELLVEITVVSYFMRVSS